MNRLIIALFLGMVAWVIIKRWLERPKSLYNYRRQPWVDHILDFLDEGRFYEAEEICTENIQKYPEVDEYKLLHIKILVAAGNLERAKKMIKKDLQDELEPGYKRLLTLYSAYLKCLEKKEVEQLSVIFEANRPPKRSPYYGLYDLWSRFLKGLNGEESNITENIINYPRATRTEQAERNYLTGVILQNSQPDYAQKLLNKTIESAPKTYFARKAKDIIKDL